MDSATDEHLRSVACLLVHDRLNDTWIGGTRCRRGRPSWTEEFDRRVGELNLGRLVIVEFADKAAAVAGYEAYKSEAMPLRPGGTLDLIIVEGTD